MRRLSAAIGIGLVATLAITGCASADVPAPTADREAYVSPLPRVCYTNIDTERMWVEWMFNGLDYFPKLHLLEPDQTWCDDFDYPPNTGIVLASLRFGQNEHAFGLSLTTRNKVVAANLTNTGVREDEPGARIILPITTSLTTTKFGGHSFGTLLKQSPGGRPLVKILMDTE